MAMNVWQVRTLAAIVAAFLGFQRQFYPPSGENYEHDAEWRNDYDFIIVGGGSAGSVLGRLLADDPRNFSILIIEAGDAEDGSANLPLPIALQKGYKFDYHYKTVPQINASLNTDNQQITMCAGKTLGGSSVLAYKMFIRGNRQDLDPWKNEFGCSEWTWDALEKYRLKMENMLISDMQEGHGKGGYVPISLPDQVTPFAEAWIKAGKELNLTHTPTLDYNLGDTRGFFRCQFMYNQSVLRSAAQLFLAPFLNTKRNIKILLRTHVQRVVFNDDKVAIGIEYITEGSDDAKIALARKEVILSAGTFRTPQILHLSGIGPKTVLNELNKLDPKIKRPGIVIRNEHVGSHIRDHAHVHGLTAIVKPNVSDLVIKNGIDWLDYFIYRKGDYVVPFAIEGLAFIQSSVTKESNYPDVELFMQSSSATDGSPPYSQIILQNLGFTEKTLKDYYGSHDGKTSIAVQVGLMNPKSTGKIITHSLDVQDYPIIDYQFLSDPQNYDLHALMDGLRAGKKALKTEAFSDYVDEIMNASIPGCERFYENQGPDSDEYLECWVRRMTGCQFHIVGSCRMGSNSTAAVVDCNLRVHGVKKLRIVDASVFPTIVRGHPLSMVILTAYKAADMILRDY